MICLRRALFFERLDELVSPTEQSHQREVCFASFELSKRVLEAFGFDSDDLQDIFKSPQSARRMLRLRNPVQRCRIESLEIRVLEEPADGIEANTKHPGTTQ